ncbi:MAG: VOC family protein [Actinobacteria bacterium]|nr:VOC family protein [Actinomycetota bacterium]
MKSITPFLWFSGHVGEAAEFYLEVFGDAELLSTMPGPGIEPMGAKLRLKNLELTLFNGGPHYELNEAFSLMVNCEDQDEVDRLWDALTADGGEPSRCGWLKDKYGVSWQIVPDVLTDLIGGEDPEGRQRATDAMLGMQKLIIEDLVEAYEGK